MNELVDGPVAVHVGDALSVLRELAPCSVDAVVTDPPYGDGEAAWDQTSIEFHVSWLKAIWPLLRPTAPILAFGSRRHEWQLCAAAHQLGIPIRGQLIWVHRQGFQPTSNAPRIEHEPVRWLAGDLCPQSDEVRRMRRYWTPPHLVVRRKSETRGFKEWVYIQDERGPVGGTVFESPRNRVSDKGSKASIRTAQKPTRVMAYFVALACPPGGLVLDPFCGSGATLSAARGLGRNCIGVDNDASCLPLIAKRIAAGALPLLELLQAEEAR